MAGWGDYVGTHPNYYANHYTLRENVPPGFFTDLIGFFLLIPFTRNFLFKILIKGKKIDKENSDKVKIIDGEIKDDKKD